MQAWILLVYKIPRKPTSSRVYVWRKLKKLGAILWHDAVWILPATRKTKEHFQWIAAEIAELQGEAQVWEANANLFGQDEALIQLFQEQSNVAYQAILELVSKPDADRVALSMAYQLARQQDYFHSELGHQVREMLQVEAKEE
jgi:hypothetical protein